MGPVVQRFLSAFYAEHLWPTLRDFGVFPLQHPLPWCAPGAALFFAGRTRGLTAARPPIDVVVASPCIDHAEADPGRLSATVLADLVHGAAVSSALSVPLLSFLGTGEEIHLLPGGDTRAAAWMQVADVVTDLFAQLHLPAGSRIVLSSDEEVWRALCALVERDRSQVCTQELNGLYHLTDGSCFPLGTPFHSYYDYYRSTLAHYRLPLLEQVLGSTLAGILVVENVQQVKAVAIARRLNAGRATEHLVTLPAPGRAGRTRATRASREQRLDLAELGCCQGAASRASDLGLRGDYLHFWSTICHDWNRLSARTDTRSSRSAGSCEEG
jgi:hypothetical protein